LVEVDGGFLHPSSAVDALDLVLAAVSGAHAVSAFANFTLLHVFAFELDGVLKTAFGVAVGYEK